MALTARRSVNVGIPCTETRSRLGARDGRDSRAWKLAELGAGCCSAGGTVMGPIGNASCFASRRARVRNPYFGATSRYRARGQYGRDTNHCLKVGFGVEIVQHARSDEGKEVGRRLRVDARPAKHPRFAPDSNGRFIVHPFLKYLELQA